MEQITINDLRRAFCDMAMEAVKDFDVQPDESEPAFYWYIAGGAEILRLVEKRAAEEETEEREKIVEATFYGNDGRAKETIRAHVRPRNETDGGPEPTGKYL